MKHRLFLIAAGSALVALTVSGWAGAQTLAAVDEAGAQAESQSSSSVQGTGSTAGIEMKVDAEHRLRVDPSLPEEPLPHRRVLFIFPGYETVQDPHQRVATLRKKQKFLLAFHKTIDPSFVVEAVAFAGGDQLIGYGPDYGPGATAFAQRVGYNAANISSTFLFTDALLPLAFHQDPRYFRKGEGSIKSRLWWTVRSEVVAYSDKGTEMPNFSAVLGFGMSTALSNAYSPPSSITLSKTMERFAVKEGVSVALNILREFGASGEREKR